MLSFSAEYLPYVVEWQRRTGGGFFLERSSSLKQAAIRALLHPRETPFLRRGWTNLHGREEICHRRAFCAMATQEDGSSPSLGPLSIDVCGRPVPLVGGPGVSESNVKYLGPSSFNHDASCFFIFHFQDMFTRLLGAYTLLIRLSLYPNEQASTGIQCFPAVDKVHDWAQRNSELGRKWRDSMFSEESDNPGNPSWI